MGTVGPRRICCHCGKETRSPKANCPHCLRVKRKYYYRHRESLTQTKREEYAALREAGICTYCRKNEPTNGHVKCDQCIAVKKEQDRRRFEARKGTRKCTNCGRQRRWSGENLKCMVCRKKAKLKRLFEREEYCLCGMERHAAEARCALCISVIGIRCKVGSYVIGYLRNESGKTVYDISGATGVSVRGVIRILGKMRDAGLLAETRYDGEQAKRYTIKGVSHG